MFLKLLQTHDLGATNATQNRKPILVFFLAATALVNYIELSFFNLPSFLLINFFFLIVFFLLVFFFRRLRAKRYIRR